jgi:hypothetical protein
MTLPQPAVGKGIANFEYRGSPYFLVFRIAHNEVVDTPEETSRTAASSLDHRRPLPPQLARRHRRPTTE